MFNSRTFDMFSYQVIFMHILCDTKIFTFFGIKAILNNLKIETLSFDPTSGG